MILLRRFCSGFCLLQEDGCIIYRPHPEQLQRTMMNIFEDFCYYIEHYMIVAEELDNNYRQLVTMPLLEHASISHIYIYAYLVTNAARYELYSYARLRRQAFGYHFQLIKALGSRCLLQVLSPPFGRHPTSYDGSSQ